MYTTHNSSGNTGMFLTNQAQPVTCTIRL